MRRKWVRIGAAVFVAAGLVFLGLLIGDQWERLQAELRAVGGYDWRIRPGWIAASLALATANLLEMSSVWVKMFRESGGGVGYPEGWRIWSATNVGRYIPGKLWHLGGLTVYLRERGESGAAGLVSSVAFQVLILVTGAAAAGTVLVGRPDLLGGASSWTTAAVLVILAASLHPAVLRRATELASRLLGEEDVDVERVGSRGLALSSVAILASWAVYGLSLWCLLRGVLGGGAPGLPETTAVFAASYVAGYLVLVSPGGLVVRESVMVGLLVSLGGLGVGVATVVAVAYRLVTTASELLFLGLVFLPPATSGLSRRGDAAPEGRPGETAGSETTSPERPRGGEGDGRTR